MPGQKDHAQTKTTSQIDNWIFKEYQKSIIFNIFGLINCDIIFHYKIRKEEEVQFIQVDRLAILRVDAKNLSELT